MQYQQQVLGVPQADPRWHSGVCDCFQDLDSCVDSYLCHCCATARQYDAVHGIPNNMNIAVFWLNFCCGTTAIINCLVRCELVQRFGIDESPCESCCCGTFCITCSICQHHRELTSRGMWPGGTLCSAPPPGYVPVAPMIAAPNQPMPPYAIPQQYYAQQPPPPPYAATQVQPRGYPKDGY